MTEPDASQTLQLAVQHHQAGRLSEAEKFYRQILAREPRQVNALHLLGVIAHQTGRHDLAVELIRQAAALAPKQPAIHSNLGEAYRPLNRLDDAVASFRKALAFQPDFLPALHGLGNALAAQGRIDDATACLREALALQPESATIRNDLGNLLAARGQFDEATALFQQAIAVKPDFAEPYNGLGSVFKDRGQLEEAVVCYRQALVLKPDHALAHNNLGTILKDQGQLEEAIVCLRRARALSPNHAGIHSNLVYTLEYHSGHEAGVLAAELHRWNQEHARPLARFIQPHPNDRSPDRRLRLGYVSPDFRTHPVGWFLRPLFAAHDRQSFELFCYSNTHRVDGVTTLLRSHTDGWREIVGQSDQQVADLIRADRIDILVDLALHTAKNRLLLFARKPAPVQVTYLGYPGHSGLETIDYRLTDIHLDPPVSGASLGRAEQPARLPETYWCYRPIVDPCPEVAALPALAAGHITFGCLNAFCKVTSETLTAWCRLLSTLPHARLVINAQPGSHRTRVHDLFAASGIDPQRVRFVGMVPPEQYLQSYSAIDIGLDPFPFPGGTTTCDALWMGVPVISLAGPTPVTRGGLSLLSNVGLSELVAHSVDDYLEKAIALARDLPRLAALRTGLRERMRCSPLMDAPRFARHLEAAYRTMWRRWCAQPTPAAVPTR